MRSRRRERLLGLERVARHRTAGQQLDPRVRAAAPGEAVTRRQPDGRPPRDAPPVLPPFPYGATRHSVDDTQWVTRTGCSTALQDRASDLGWRVRGHHPDACGARAGDGVMATYRPDARAIGGDGRCAHVADHAAAHARLWRLAEVEPLTTSRPVSLDPPSSSAGSVRLAAKNDLLSRTFIGC